MFPLTTAKTKVFRLDDELQRCLEYQRRLWLDFATPYLAMIGGTGSGKTWFVPRWLLSRIIGNAGHEWIVSAPTIPMLKRNPWKYCLYWWRDRWGLPLEDNKTDLTINFDGRAGLKGTVHFISAENPDRMQGIHAKGIVGDEAGLYDRLWWDTAVQRVAYHKGQILLTTTPYSYNWLKSEVWDPWVEGDENFHVENPSAIDNPHYPREEYERARRQLPAWKFKMLFEGKFTRPAGLIYEQYEVVEPFEVPPDWPRFAGVDFGFNNPFAVAWLAENPASGEVFVVYEFKRSGLTVDDMEAVLRKQGPDRCIYYGDPASKETLETLRARGIDIRPAKKDVMAGISFLQGLFQTGRLKVFRNLTYTLDELNSYQWQMDRAEQLIDKPHKVNDHLMDALRYGAFTYLEERPGAPTVKLMGLSRRTSGMFRGF